MRNIGLCLFALILCMMMFGSGQGYAEKNASPAIQLYLEGNQLVPDVPPKIVQGRTLVPIRVVVEGLGANVEWDPIEKRVDIALNGTQITMHIGNKKAKVNSREVILDVPPAIENSRTLVPLRFIGEALGKTVGFEDATRSVVINKIYKLQANGQLLPANNKIYKVDEELYLPLAVIAPFVGATLEPAEQSGVDLLTYQNQRISLSTAGHVSWKLKKMDTGWVMPVSAVQEHFQANVTVDEAAGLVKLEKLSRLLSIREENNRIHIESSEWMTPKHFLMTGPHRLVVDIPNTVLDEQLFDETEVPSLPANNGTSYITEANQNDSVPSEPVVREIRFSQFSVEPYTVRVVIELSQKCKYMFSMEDTGYRIDLQPLPKKEGFLIVLDPGHGGKDPGAIGVDGNKEKDFTLAVSKLLKEELKQFAGLQVIETRMDDTYPSLQDRVQMANDVEADLFLSIHANAFKPETRGTETFYYTPQSEAFAKVIHRHLQSATGFPDRGVKKAGFFVIKNSKMPSALVEIGFLTNKEENRQLQNPEFQKKVAKALGQAIFEYYTSYH